MKQKYDIIYSIGRDCACAMYMKQANLRACSGPFDWLTNANFETRIDLILNDFQDFINKNDIVPLEKEMAWEREKREGAWRINMND